MAHSCYCRTSVLIRDPALSASCWVAPVRCHQIHSEKSEIQAADLNELRNDNLSELGKYYYTESRISSLPKDFPCRSCSGLRIRICTLAFDFTVYECRQPRLSSIIHLWRLFNSSSLFSSCRALLNPTFSLALFSPLLSFSAYFHPMSAFLSCLKPFILSCTPPPSPPPPSLYISPNFEVPVSTWAWQVKGVSLLLFSPPPSCSSKSCSAIDLPHHTISSHVRETCRHPSATFDHCFYWDPSLPCSALGWQRRQSVKEWKG